jgi:hypothetical protein
MLIMDDNDDISPMIILTRGLKSKGLNVSMNECYKDSLIF